MTIAYDKYYQSKNLFGEPYPELIRFFSEYPEKARMLDLGCGQGRDAIAIARMGHCVTGLDHSAVGIRQMNQVAKVENLNLTGQVTDIYTFDKFNDFDIILLDNIFHFTRKDKEKESALMRKILSERNKDCLVIVCIQDSGRKVQALNQAIDFERQLNRRAEIKFSHTYVDQENGHRSKTNYRMIIIGN